MTLSTPDRFVEIIPDAWVYVQTKGDNEEVTQEFYMDWGEIPEPVQCAVRTLDKMVEDFCCLCEPVAGTTNN
jgi:hypothetical protein